MSRTLAALSIATALATPLAAQDAIAPAIGTSASIDIKSQYALRGLIYSDKPVVQSVATLERGPFSGTLFLNCDADTCNEINAIGSATRRIGAIELLGELTYLTFPTTDLDDTVEAKAQASLPDLPGAPRITVAHDFHLSKGTYAEIGAGIGLPGEIDATAALGYNDKYYTKRTGISHLELSLSRPFSALGMTLTPSVTAIKRLRGDFTDAVVLGLSLSK